MRVQFGFVLALAGGCSFHPGAFGGGSGSGSDAAIGDGRTDAPDIDGMMASPDAGNCWSVPGVAVDVCLAAPLSGTLDVTVDSSIDTDSSGPGLRQCRPVVSGNTDVCVIPAQSITIQLGATLGAHGSRPLVLIAQSISIIGTLDVASHRGTQQGPDANAAGCSAGTAASGVGGGRGGSLGGVGGNGGDEAGQNNGGDAGAALTVTTLRGGCPGGTGGNGNGGADGGGAVLLIANSISLAATGVINASGASGQGGSSGREGGSGAGSGGMIVLSAPSVALAPTSQIFANGGHGGGGSDNSTAGFNGTDPTGATSGGSNGIGTGGAGDGGPGFPAVSRVGQNGTSNDGAGGGGGGAGVIEVFGTTLTSGMVSPAPS
jgi:hypothetical protein